MLPVWCTAAKRVRESLATRQAPLLAIGAAFCFTIMMFNIPAFGGTTVHPVGGVLLAVLLGPWAASIGMTVALVIQALFFGDGGVLAVGANCFTMAFAMPFCGYVAYRLCSVRSAEGSSRRALAAGVGGYVGLNLAALLTALLLGLQPALYHDAAGHALYFPFGLKVTIPAIMAAHLTVAGVAEAVVTVLAVRYVQALGIPLYGVRESGDRRGRLELLWAGLGALAALVPLGLLASGEAWGEWASKDIAAKVGYVPSALASSEAHGWKGFNLLPDYLGDHGAWAYVLAALFGIVVITLCGLALGRLLARRGAGPAESETPIVVPAVAPGQIPAWMLSAETAHKSEPTNACKARTDYLERTLSGLAEGVRETVFTERWARQDGLLQRLDPRGKIFVLMAFVVVTSLLHHTGLLVALYGLSLLLGAASCLPVGVMLKRVWLAVPLFVGAVTLPVVFSFATPGPPLLVLSSDPYVSITRPGFALAALLTLRVAVAVSFVTLLTLTTRWNDLLRGLRVLFVPKLFLTILAMTYRYLGVLMQSATEVFTARKSRTVGRSTSSRNRKFVGTAIGNLFGKTLALTDEVHAAMLSRGWSGEARTLRPFALTSADVTWAAIMGALAASALWLEAIWK